MKARRATLFLTVSRPWSFPLLVRGHGWFDLAPHEWDEERERLATVVRVGDQAVDCVLEAEEEGIRVAVASRDRLPAETRRELERGLRTMFRLDEDLREFWRLCRAHPRCGWAARKGGGRLMRSISLFEDLMKLLFTTNCSWAATRAMTAKLVAAAGSVAPSGRRAFPTPEELAGRDERFWRDEVRVGYRARAARELVQGFRDGRIAAAEIAGLRDARELRRRLLAIRGFGPYAAGQAARLLGCYEDLALDSWCRARIAEILGRGKPPGDAAIARRYAAFGPWAGLALWVDLTREWHVG